MIIHVETTGHIYIEEVPFFQFAVQGNISWACVQHLTSSCIYILSDVMCTIIYIARQLVLLLWHFALCLGHMVIPWRVRALIEDNRRPSRLLFASKQAGPHSFECFCRLLVHTKPDETNERNQHPEPANRTNWIKHVKPTTGYHMLSLQRDTKRNESNLQ